MFEKLKHPIMEKAETAFFLFLFLFLKIFYIVYNKLFLHSNGRHVKYHCTSPASIPVVGMCLDDSNSYGCLYNLIFFLVFHWEVEHSHVTKLQRFRRWSSFSNIFAIDSNRL